MTLIGFRVNQDIINEHHDEPIEAILEYSIIKCMKNASALVNPKDITINS